MMLGPLGLSFKELINLLEKEHERSLRCLREENLQLRESVKDSLEDNQTPTKLVNDWDTMACGEDVGKRIVSNTISPTLAEDVQHAELVELTDSPVGRNRSLAMDLGLNLCPVWTAESPARSNPADLFVGDRLAMELFMQSKKVVQGGTRDSVIKAVLFNCPREWSDVVMGPTSRKVVSWSIMACSLLIYDLCFIPVQVAFQPAPSAHTRFLDLLSISYWTLDILLNFFIGFYTKRGKVEKRFVPIARRYMRSHFLLDIAIVSFDWLKVAIDNLPQGPGLLRAGKFLRFLRFARSLRLIRLTRVQALLRTLLEFVTAESVMIVCDISLKMVVLLAVNHVVACLWYLIGTGTKGWVRKARIEGGLWEAYLISLHWALTSFNPAQKPAVRATTLTERGFAVLLIFFAMVCMSTFVSSITAQMTRFRQIKTSSISQLFTLRKFLEQKGITSDLSARIIRYVQVARSIHQQNLSRDKVELLKYLSGPLSIELESEIYSPFLCRHPFFETYRGWSPSSMSCVCYAAVHQEHYSKGDQIFSYGRESAHMYFLYTGCLYYMRPKNMMWDNSRPNAPSDANRVLVVNKGDWFCEGTLWVSWMHRGAMGTLIESETIQLNSCKFQQITKEHSDAYERCRMWANGFLISLLETYQCHGCLWDLPPEMVYSNSSDTQISEDLDNV